MAEALTSALETVEADQAETEVTAPTYKDNLVGEGKKFSQDEELAKAYHHANLHIEELKADLAEYKGGKELLNEVLNEIRSSSIEESTTPLAPPQASVETQIPQDNVAKLVGEEFTKRETMAQIEANVATSVSKLREVYGTDSQVKAAVAKAINGDQGVQDIIDSLSRKNPDTMVKFITGLVPAGNEASSNTPGVGSGSPPPAYSGELTWSQCKEMKKDKPLVYNSREFRLRIEMAANKAAEAGTDFFAT
jgi:hypothetical protein